MDLSPPDPLSSLLPVLEPAALTNFYGPPGVGKTNLCILLALACAKNGGMVAYIDSEGGFSLERAKQIDSQCQLFLKNIDLLQPKTFKEQAGMVKSMDKKYDLVLLDSAVALYRLEYAEHANSPAGSAVKLQAAAKAEALKTENRELKTRRLDNPAVLDANRELSVQLATLSNLAREKNIPVVITAHAYTKTESGELDMVGGDTIKYWSKTIVQIERTAHANERKATLVKHRSRPEGMQVRFEIVNEGIKPAGFRLF